jgi:hypothetical protein
MAVMRKIHQASFRLFSTDFTYTNIILHFETSFDLFLYVLLPQRPMQFPAFGLKFSLACVFVQQAVEFAA